MKFKKIIKLFQNGSVCVFGVRGSGKDLLMSNVIVRRNRPYISNIDYGGKYLPFEPSKLDCGKNTYKNFITGNIKQYKCPYEDGTDVYLSDGGIYFPSQYNSELNREYPYFPVYVALSRQINLSSLHYNSQALNRVWDKYREMSEIYIYCKKCIYIKCLNIVIQKIRIYDDYESAKQKRRAFMIKTPWFAKKELKINIKMQKLNYEAQYGEIKEGILIYRNKSTYDTRRFKKILEEGTHYEKIQ